MYSKRGKRATKALAHVAQHAPTRATLHSIPLRNSGGPQQARANKKKRLCLSSTSTSPSYSRNTQSSSQSCSWCCAERILGFNAKLKTRSWYLAPKDPQLKASMQIQCNGVGGLVAQRCQTAKCLVSKPFFSAAQNTMGRKARPFIAKRAPSSPIRQSGSSTGSHRCAPRSLLVSKFFLLEVSSCS